jgi:glycosyltransferase involved in cell wall biosynthesis
VSQEAKNSVPQIIPAQPGVPRYSIQAFAEKKARYCLLIPIINEGSRILAELDRAQKANIPQAVDIILCDGGSTDGSMASENLTARGVNTLLTKLDSGKQGAQLRMGLHFALARGYTGVLTVDGNNKDSIESVPLFIEKLEAGYDFVQGSRFIKGGRAVNTPAVRYWAVRLIHAPVISLAAHQWFTDTTNAYRAYSRRYLEDARVQPLRSIFAGYELLAYLSVRASQLGMKACEVPVVREYPKTGATPTKIKGMKGNNELLGCLWGALTGKYNP